MGAALPFIAGGMQVFSAIQGAAAQKYQGEAAANQSKYQSAVAANNAIVSRRNADMAAREGNAAVEAKQMENRAKIGAITAAQGASGVDLNYGSAVDVRSSAAQTGQLSAINIRSQAIRKAYGYQNEASDFDTQSKLYTQQAKNDKTAGTMNATTTLLGGLSDSANSWQKYKDVSSTTGGIWN